MCRFGFLLYIIPSLFLHAQVKEKVKIDRRLADTSAPYIFALDNLPRRHVTTVNLAALFALNGHFTYEWRALNFLGFKLQAMGGRFRQLSTMPLLPYRVRSYLVGTSADLVFYPLKKAPRGLYFTVGGGYRWYDSDIPYLALIAPDMYFVAHGFKSFHLISASTGVGWQFIAGNWFVINPYMGLSLNKQDGVRIRGKVSDYVKDFTVPGTSLLAFRFGLFLGLAFK